MADQQKKRNRLTEGASVQQQNENAETIDLVELMYRLLGSWKLLLCLALAFAITAGVYTSFL